MSDVTAWVTAEHLSHDNPVLAGARRVLMIESRAALGARRFHRRRLHLVLTAMRTFARECAERGIEVDYRRAASFADGVNAHLRERGRVEVRVLAPTGHRARAALAHIDGVRFVDETLLLTHPDEFARWARSRRRMMMADFYRHQRRRLGILMDGERPTGGRWSYDVANREPPPRDRRPPRPYRPRETEIDAEVRRDLAGMRLRTVGSDGPRELPASRDEARRALDRFLETRLADFGRWQDAMLHGERYMWHSLLSSSLNLGLLSPRECAERAEARYRTGEAPIAAVEGFVRQVIGWREYVWGSTEHSTGPVATRCRPAHRFRLSSGAAPPTCAACRTRCPGSSSTATHTTSSG